jgi:spore coat polysaccharide biosynthesis protein SpsF
LRVVAIIQARMMSARLPAKVLLDLGGKTALERCLARVRRIRHLAEVVVATSTRPEDDIIVALCRRIGVPAFRGSETDVLARYHQVANETSADAVVRVTADCPLLDPELSSFVVEAYLREQQTARPPHYVSNTLVRRLPRGLDTELVSMEALEAAFSQATGDEREHVTAHLYRHPEQFRCLLALPPALGEQDLSHHRWTLDTVDDYRFLYLLFAKLGPAAESAPMNELLELLKSNAELLSINAHVQQKA